MKRCQREWVKGEVFGLIWVTLITRGIIDALLYVRTTMFEVILFLETLELIFCDVLIFQCIFETSFDYNSTH